VCPRNCWTQCDQVSDEVFRSKEVIIIENETAMDLFFWGGKGIVCENRSDENSVEVFICKRLSTPHHRQSVLHFFSYSSLSSFDAGDVVRIRTSRRAVPPNKTSEFVSRVSRGPQSPSKIPPPTVGA